MYREWQMSKVVWVGIEEKQRTSWLPRKGNSDASCQPIFETWESEDATSPDPQKKKIWKCELLYEIS